MSSPAAHQRAQQECTAVLGPSLGTIPNTTGPCSTVHCTGGGGGAELLESPICTLQGRRPDTSGDIHVVTCPDLSRLWPCYSLGGVSALCARCAPRELSRFVECVWERGMQEKGMMGLGENITRFWSMDLGPCVWCFERWVVLGLVPVQSPQQQMLYTCSAEIPKEYGVGWCGGWGGYAAFRVVEGLGTDARHHRGLVRCTCMRQGVQHRCQHHEAHVPAVMRITGSHHICSR